MAVNCKGMKATFQIVFLHIDEGPFWRMIHLVKK